MKKTASLFVAVAALNLPLSHLAASRNAHQDSLNLTALKALNFSTLNAAEVMLDKVEVSADANATKKPGKLTRADMDLITSKNHTITELLKSNPNVSFNAKNNKGINAGDIAPQDVSINGASYYQNNFTLDGASINNDLDPKKSTRNNHNNTWSDSTIGSQAMSVDTDLLGSVEVLDSGVSARYGSFQGGVVNAKTRDPRAGFHGVLGYSYTSGSWSKIFKDASIDTKYNDGELADMSDFKKRRYRIGLEGYVTSNFGLLFDYTRHRSVIENHYNKKQINHSLYSFPDDKQTNDNYYVKGVIGVGERVTLKPSFLYSTLTNHTSAKRYLNSQLDLIYGGYVAMLEADIDLDSVFLEQSLSFTSSQTTRDYEHDTEYYNYKISNIKNWGISNSGIGGYNDFIQRQKKLAYKFDASVQEFDAFGALHNIKSGFEITRQIGSYEIPHTYVWNGNPKALMSGTCEAGDKTCVIDDSFASQGAVGQYLSKKTYYYAVKTKAAQTNLALYLEDEMRFGAFKFRPGLRIERNGDNNDVNLAPRLLAEYEFADKNFIGLGLNRYYGRNFFAYKMYNGVYRMYETCERSSYGGAYTCGGLANNRRPIRELKTPYDDEFSAYYRGDVGNARLNLKYVRRQGRDEVATKYVREPLTGYGNGYSIFTNEGQSKRDIVTLSAANIAPIEIWGVKNDFEGSLSFTKQSRSFTDYEDDEMNDDVSYNGKTIKKSELPVVDYHVPFTAKFRHSAKFSGFSVSNFINYTSKTDALLGGWNRTRGMYVYERQKLPAYATWDMRIGYERRLAGDFRAFVNLDINNLLNKKFIASNEGNYYEYGLGRNFWLEAGMKW